MKPLRRQAMSILKWKLLPALLGLLFVQAALATDALYDNTGVSQYSIPGTPPPPIDARNFQNEANAEFELGFGVYTPYPELYETWNTVNYTNLGLMVANSPATTNGSILLLLPGTPVTYGSFGSGFNFDRQTTNQLSREIAGTVYNSGDIRCDSILDGNNFFTINLGLGLLDTFYAVTGLGQFEAWATNIISPGSIDVGTGGLIQMKGQNVDLSGGSLNVEPLLNTTIFTFFGLNPILNNASTEGFNGVGVVGGSLWVPGFDLTANSATASYPFFPNPFTLTNSTAYIHPDETDPVFTNTKVHRSVFIVNYSPDAAVTANVYFDPLTQYSQFGLPDPGCVNIGWSANTIDPATGNPVNNYLYLTDDYVWGASTNVFVFANGQPDNFQFDASPTPLLFGPAVSGFVNEFPFIVVTNLFAYMSGSLTASTVATNASGVNPSGNITNLASRIQLTASNTLNLAFTAVNGPNYLSLNCTNQFQGSPGAAIAAPFSDIALGVTNGFLTLSNVLMANLPNFSGTIQSWSTRFETVDTTVTPNITNDYRILLVYSAFEPSTQPWVQNLYLHGTNTLTLSDHYNVYGSMYSDATSLTLNTNQVGVGATSFDGELFWFNPATFNANSGSGLQQFPNLLWVTNNGAIRTLNNANFGNAATPQFITTPAVPGVPASGTLSEAGTNAVVGDLVTIGASQYTFVKALANATANQVKWATNFDGSLNNLIAAINGAAGAGTNYSTATKSNLSVTAGPLSKHAFTVTALTAGTNGDLILTGFTPATTATNLAWGLPTLTNGANYIGPITNYTSFLNHSLLADQGTAIWTSYFESDGTISNGTGSLIVQSGKTVLVNGNVVAGGDVVLVATNSPGLGYNELQISNQFIQVAHQLTLVCTNLTGDALTNNNVFVVGTASIGGTVDSGFNTLLKGSGNLLGTTVTNIAPLNKTIYNVWAGTDYGISAVGFTNNLAVGHLVLDSLTTNNPNPPLAFVFSGAGVSNALYVDLLELRDGATAGNPTNNYNFPWLKINPNMMVYYGRAIRDVNGQIFDASEAIDYASQFGANAGRLRWVDSYAGYLSSTNLLTTNAVGVIFTNAVNTALLQSAVIDSDSDGIPNASDPTPFFAPPFIDPAVLNFTVSVTNLPPKAVKVQWTTIPNATNFIYYTTNLLATNGWLAFTNFNYSYFGNNLTNSHPPVNNSFVSPQVYLNNPLLPDNSQKTNVWLYDTITNVPHFYKVLVWPNLMQNATNAP